MFTHSFRTGHSGGFIDRFANKLVSEAGINKNSPSLEGVLVARLEVFVYATLWTVIFVSVFISCALTLFFDQTLTVSQHYVVVGGLIICALTAGLLPADSVREWFFLERPFDEKYIGKPASGLHFGAVHKSPMFWGRALFSLLAICLASVLS